MREPPATPEAVAAQHERDAELWRAINRLDEKHRLPLVLHYYHDLPTAEIAQILQISEGTVHSRLHIARGHIRAELKLIDQV
jgi:RNA polymerase sigma-70 factor (ECF subfamily)